MAWEGHTQPLQILTKSTLLLHGKTECDRLPLQRAAFPSKSSAVAVGPTPFPPTKLLTEIQAGGVIFTDVAYSKWGRDSPLLFLRSLVTSRPSPKEYHRHRLENSPWLVSRSQTTWDR